MSSNDRFPQGGDLNDMAATGTRVDPSAAEPRYIRSVPSQGQKISADDADYNASGDLAGAATNAVDIPRSAADQGATGEVFTAAAGGLVGGAAGATETKNLTTSSGDADLAKGSLRMEKHARQKGSDFERRAGDGAEMDPAPGEEGLSQDEIRDGRDGL